jgi:hypothetical protein
MLPLEKGQKIVSLESQARELIPEIPLLQDAIVNVCCTDNFGRQFVVGMQIIWTPVFKYRVLLNASKADVLLMEEDETKEALKYLERDSYSNAELNAYDKYWDVILTTHTYYADAYAEGIAKSEAIGIAKGEEEYLIKVIINSARAGFSLEQIQLFTNLSKERIEEILNSKIQ